jgi:hypothetical protein
MQSVPVLVDYSINHTHLQLVPNSLKLSLAISTGNPSHLDDQRRVKLQVMHERTVCFRLCYKLPVLTVKLKLASLFGCRFHVLA